MCTGVRGRRFGGLVYGQSGPRGPLVARRLQGSAALRRWKGQGPPGRRGAELPAHTLARALIKSSFVSRSLSLAHQLYRTPASEPATSSTARCKAGGGPAWLVLPGGGAPDSRGHNASSLCARLPPTQRPVGAPSRLAGTAAEKNAGLRPQHPPGGHTSGKKDSSSHIRKEAPFLYKLAPTATKRIFVVLVHARTKTLYNGPYVSPPVSASLQTTRLGSPCIVPRKYDPGCLRPNQSSTKCFFSFCFSGPAKVRRRHAYFSERPHRDLQQRNTMYIALYISSYFVCMHERTEGS